MVCIITILTKATETEYNDLHAQLQRDTLKEVVNMFALWLKLSETLFFCNRWLTYVSYRATQRLFINSSVEPSFDISNQVRRANISLVNMKSTVKLLC